jgi:hypothetical protein
MKKKVDTAESVKSRPSKLMTLAMKYFTREGYTIEESITKDGYSGILRSFDLIIKKKNSLQGVWIRDWKRTIGVNIVINVDKASYDVGFANPIIIGEKFSDHAKAYANRRQVLLLTKRQLMLSLR